MGYKGKEDPSVEGNSERKIEINRKDLGTRRGFLFFVFLPLSLNYFLL